MGISSESNPLKKNKNIFSDFQKPGMWYFTDMVYVMFWSDRYSLKPAGHIGARLLFFFFTWMFCLTCLVKYTSGFFTSGPFFSWSLLQGRECLPHSLLDKVPSSLAGSGLSKQHEFPSHAAHPATCHSGQWERRRRLLMRTVLLGVAGIVVVMYPLSTRYICLQCLCFSCGFGSCT